MKKSSEKEKSILVSYVKELVRASEYSIKLGNFLTPAEQRVAFDAACEEGARERCFFWGGVPGCERRMVVMIPDWMCSEGDFGGAFDPSREEFIYETVSRGDDSGEIKDSVRPVEIYSSGYDAPLTHRDYLGAILGLGVERDMTGDIAVMSDFGAVAFVSSKVADFVILNLEKVGSAPVKTAAASLDCGFRISSEFETITDTVMSVRLDGVVKALCRVSREEAARLVEKGDVSLNYIEETKTDKGLKKGDVLSVRGHGKFIYDGDRGVNRRGRIRIDARKYV